MARPALALAALILGCGSSVAAVPVIEIPPLPDLAAEPAVEQVPEIPFAGTYERYAVVSFKLGRAIVLNNSVGQSSLKIEPGRVVYEQSYLRSGSKKHVIQIYSFDPASVRRSGDAYDVRLLHRSLRGDTEGYSPDSGQPRLAVHKRAWGWDLVLMTVDTSHVIAGVAFGTAPPGEPPPDISDYRTLHEETPP